MTYWKIAIAVWVTPIPLAALGCSVYWIWMVLTDLWKWALR